MLYSQLYFNSGDWLSLFLVEEDTIDPTDYNIKFRPRLLRLGRSALEVPIATKDHRLSLLSEWHGLEWNPMALAIQLNELYPQQRNGLWSKVARVYGLPFQEIIGIAIPGGGTGSHGIRINLLDVTSGDTYTGGITVWHDSSAPLSTVHLAPFKSQVTPIVLKMAGRFGVRTSKSRLGRECLRWRVAHGRNAKAGSEKVRWIPRKDVQATISDKTDVALGKYPVHAIFKGPLVLSDEESIAVIYVPRSPYDMGALTSYGEGKVLWTSGSREVVFDIADNIVTYKALEKKKEPPQAE